MTTLVRLECAFGDVIGRSNFDNRWVLSGTSRGAKTGWAIQGSRGAQSCRRRSRQVWGIHSPVIIHFTFPALTLRQPYFTSGDDSVVGRECPWGKKGAKIEFCVINAMYTVASETRALDT